MQELFHKYFRYEDGMLFWKEGTAKFINKRAGSHKKGEGSYRVVVLNQVKYHEHRVIYTMFHGECPAMLDHIDRDCTNNRIENLRPTTYADNNRNRAKFGRFGKPPASKYKGVTITKAGKYMSRATFDGVQHYLGVHAEEYDAYIAFVRFMLSKGVEIYELV